MTGREQAIAGGKPALGALKQSLMRRLNELTSYPADVPLTSLKIKALVLDLIHNMDVVDQLLNAKTASLSDWQWRKQLRYYLDDSGGVVMRIVTAQFDYTYEYQGNAGKLVHTPTWCCCDLAQTGFYWVKATASFAMRTRS